MATEIKTKILRVPDILGTDPSQFIFNFFDRREMIQQNSSYF